MTVRYVHLIDLSNQQDREPDGISMPPAIPPTPSPEVPHA